VDQADVSCGDSGEGTSGAAVTARAFAECFHPDRDPFWWNLIATARDLRDSYLTLSDEPGLGWTLDWDCVNRYRVD